jgi:hypothetical protein
MPAVQFTVVPFGNRWAIQRGARRLSIETSLDGAMEAVTELADTATVAGEQAVILVQQREGGWREFTYTHEPDHRRPIDMRKLRRG